jgi:hypothetical protein
MRTWIRSLPPCAAALLLAISLTALGQEEEPKPAATPEQKVAGENAKGRIQDLVNSHSLPNETLAKEALDVINVLLKNTRADQASIYAFVRTVNRNLDQLELDPTCDVDCKNDIKTARAINKKLMKSSYTDGLFQNANLSNQIQTRLPLLIADSVKLNADKTPAFRDDFIDELDLLKERYLSSKRFRAGVGLSYSYLPRINYQATPRVDFSPFQTAASGGSDVVVFNTDFSNRSVPALLISAKVPILQLDVGIPDAKHTETTTTTVQQRAGDADNDLLARTTIKSELKIEYDVSLKVSPLDVYNWWQDKHGRRPANLQFDYGAGIGLTGFQIKDDVSTDVRFRSDPGDVFNDLPAGTTITSSNASSFTTVFASLYFAFRVSDELQLGFETRYYQKDRTSSSEVKVDGATFSLSGIWYPTFNW